MPLFGNYHKVIKRLEAEQRLTIYNFKSVKKDNENKILMLKKWMISMNKMNNKYEKMNDKYKEMNDKYKEIMSLVW